MSTNENPIIKIKNVSKFYQAGQNRVAALSGISLEIQPGDFSTIMGPSGGGKTTLLNCIGGLDSPDEGEIYFNGQRMTTMQDKQLTELRREQIGFVFQFFNLLPTLTLRENVELPLLLAQSAKGKENRIDSLLEYVGLLHRAQSFPAELSGGEMQRVAIARALVHQPSLLLADEPTGNLDTENGVKILELMKQASIDFKTTVVVVTHNPQIAEYGNRHFVIRDGKLQPDE
jgi:putative ABC transport system ATP-binding protein